MSAYLRQVGNSRMRTSLLDKFVWRDGGDNLTFRGHVTSLITWPFDLRWSTSYRWSTATMHLSGTARDMAPQSTCTQTNTQTDTQNDRSHNLLQCSLCSHLAEVINVNTSSEVRAAVMKELSRDYNRPHHNTTACFHVFHASHKL